MKRKGSDAYVSVVIVEVYKNKIPNMDDGREGTEGIVKKVDCRRK